MEAINKRQLVRLSTTQEYIFRIPPHINLEDKNQVKHWGMEGCVLVIEHLDGTKIRINTEYVHPSEYDLYYKSTTEIETYNEKEET
jgi:hypothetical protein